MEFPADKLSSLRRRAEARVETAGTGRSATGPDGDPIRLLHELQVHQIELELQNEDLQTINQDLELLRARYQALYELAPVGYMTLSIDGVIGDLNRRAVDMIRRDREALLGSALRECFAPASQSGFDQLLHAAARSTEIVIADDLMLNRPLGLAAFVQVQMRRLEQEAALLLVVMTDITALKQAKDDVVTAIDRK